jgi:hypothetical protein
MQSGPLDEGRCEEASGSDARVVFLLAIYDNVEEMLL